MSAGNRLERAGGGTALVRRIFLALSNRFDILFYRKLLGSNQDEDPLSGEAFLGRQ